MTKRIVSGIFILTALGALGVILAGALTSGEQLIVRFLTAVIVAALGLYVISDLRLQTEEAKGTKPVRTRQAPDNPAPANSTAAYMATVTGRLDGTEGGQDVQPSATAPDRSMFARSEPTESAAGTESGGSRPVFDRPSHRADASSMTVEPVRSGSPPLPPSTPTTGPAPMDTVTRSKGSLAAFDLNDLTDTVKVPIDPWTSEHGSAEHGLAETEVDHAWGAPTSEGSDETESAHDKAEIDEFGPLRALATTGGGPSTFERFVIESGNGRGPSGAQDPSAESEDETGLDSPPSEFDVETAAPSTRWWPNDDENVEGETSVSSAGTTPPHPPGRHLRAVPDADPGPNLDVTGSGDSDGGEETGKEIDLTAIDLTNDDDATLEHRQLDPVSDTVHAEYAESASELESNGSEDQADEPIESTAKEESSPTAPIAADAEDTPEAEPTGEAAQPDTNHRRLEAASYALPAQRPIIDLREDAVQPAGVTRAIKAGERQVIDTLIRQGMLSTNGPITDRDVRTMVYVAFTSNELRKLILAGGRPDTERSELNLGEVELFDERRFAPTPRKIYMPPDGEAAGQSLAAGTSGPETATTAAGASPIAAPPTEARSFEAPSVEQRPAEPAPALSSADPSESSAGLPDATETADLPTLPTPKHAYRLHNGSSAEAASRY